MLGGASENTRRQYQVVGVLYTLGGDTPGGDTRAQGGGDEEEIMLQYAIRQSLAEPGDQVWWCWGSLCHNHHLSLILK